MKLLFDHSQTSGRFLAVQFRLYAKVELEGEEKPLISRYRFAEAMLVAHLEEKLIRNAAFVALGAAILAWMILSLIGMGWIPLAGLIGVGAGYFFFHQMRATIFVKDLLHGRYFSCRSVIDLAREERRLTNAVTILRQVIESAKHWDETEINQIPVLEKEDARRLVSRL